MKRLQYQHGKSMFFQTIGVISSILLIAGVTLGSPVSQLLPSSNEVSGWSPYEGTLTYCPNPSSLTEIYDGGFEVYTRHGVTEAATQIYRKGKTITSVVVHRMNSPKEAKSFFRYWLSQKKKNLLSRPTLKDEAFLAKEGSMTAGYHWRGAYYTKVEVNAIGKEAQTVAVSFMTTISKKIR